METISDQIDIFTPLGIRFWDPVTDTQVADGLSVSARPVSSSGSTRSAVRTVGGIYAFHNLPGLHDYEYPREVDQRHSIRFFGLEQHVHDGASDAPFSPPAPRPFQITILDRRKRFLTTSFRIELPLSEEGIYTLSVPSSLPEDAPPGFYLFSAPGRTVLPGIGVVRAQLTDVFTEEAAAYAILEVYVAGAPDPVYYGLADATGQVAVLFPYPRILTTLEGSPPSGQTPLFEQTWPLTVRVRYGPGAISFSAESITGDSDVPDLRTVVTQPPGLLRLVPPVSPVATTPTDELSATLRYAEPTVLRSEGRADLLIQSNSSPL